MMIFYGEKPSRLSCILFPGRRFFFRLNVEFFRKRNVNFVIDFFWNFHIHFAISVNSSERKNNKQHQKKYCVISYIIFCSIKISFTAFDAYDDDDDIVFVCGIYAHKHTKRQARVTIVDICLFIRFFSSASNRVLVCILPLIKSTSKVGH